MPPELAGKLLEWERRRREGTPVTPEELCADSPDMVNELRRRIRRLEACDQLLGLDDTAYGPTGPEPELPAAIAGFEVRGKLGRGGMGDVYDGWDPTLQREVAVKVLRLPADYWPFARTQELVGRFSREGAVLARLEHPHIVPVYQAGIWEGRPYIAMARIGSGSLADCREQLSHQGPRAVAAFMQKVAAAVDAAHQHKVLHRDLKPANILVGGQGEPRVADFGLAKLWTVDEPTQDSLDSARDDPAELTARGAQPGTPPYMAPEQLDPARGSVGPPTDVWALGVILHELLTGNRPFAGETRRELTDNVCRMPTPSCRAINRRVPRWLDAIVGRCLAKSPADRYQSTADLASALGAGLQRGRRARWLASSVAVLALVLAGGIVGGRWLSGRLDDPPVPMASPEPRFEELPEVVSALATLRQGKEVTLIGPEVRAPYRWVLGEQTGKENTAGPGLVRLLSNWPGPAPVEFLPDLPPGRFLVTAELCQHTGERFSCAALYARGHSWESKSGRHLVCAWLSFADHGEKADPHLGAAPPGSSVSEFGSVHLVNTTGRGPPARFTSSGVYFLPYSSAKTEGRAADFRSVGLIVDRTGVQGRWGGQNAGEMDAATADEFLTRFRQNFPPTNLPARASGGLGGVGLILYGGELIVRSLRVVPLAE